MCPNVELLQYYSAKLNSTCYLSSIVFHLYSGMSTPVSRVTSSLNGIQNVSRDANPHILKQGLHGIRSKSRDSGKYFNQSPVNARRTKSSPGSDELLNSSASVSTNKTAQTTADEGINLLFLDRDFGQFSGRRRISMDYSHSENQVPPSSERRQSSGVGEQGFHRSPSSDRARCFDRVEGGTAVGVPARCRPLSRERNFGTNTGDVLMVTRDRRGLHSVQDFHGVSNSLLPIRNASIYDLISKYDLLGYQCACI